MISIDFEGQSEFKAGSTRGYKLAYNSVHKAGYKLRTVQYAFNGKGHTKIVITGTMPLSQKEVFEKLFDEAVKTFNITK